MIDRRQQIVRSCHTGGGSRRWTVRIYLDWRLIRMQPSISYCQSPFALLSFFYSPVSFQNKRILKRIAVGVYRQNQPAWLRRRRNGKNRDDSGFTWTYFLLDIVWKEPVSPHGDSKWWKTNFRLNRKCIASPPVGKKTQRQISVKASDNIKI